MLAKSPLWAIVPATNLERAKKFYGGTLNLPTLGARNGRDPHVPLH